MQFFQVTQRMEHSGQDSVNIFWYRRDSTGLPTDADLAALRDYWVATFWPSWAGMLSNQVRLKQITVQGYRDTWERAPYLPLISDHDLPGLSAGAAGSPLLAATLSARVEPVAPNPLNGAPVRRGFWSVGGLPATYYGANGLMNPLFFTEAAFIAGKTRASTTFALSTAPEQLQPIKVSVPTDTGARGYGLIKGAVWRQPVSTRRSRMVGSGAR